MSVSPYIFLMGGNSLKTSVTGPHQGPDLKVILFPETIGGDVNWQQG